MSTSKPQLKPVETEGLYFKKELKSKIEFVHSGCVLLDCILGGGWALGRMSNVAGESATAKSLLAIEAMINFHRQFPKGKIYYLEAEGAFDPDYAEDLGLPLDKVIMVEEYLDDFTIESWYEHAFEMLKENENSKAPVFYAVDSLDALSDRAELNRKIDEGTYGGNKPKKIGELFRRLTKRLESTQVHLMIVSQIRDNIGVTFGSKKTQSGGNAVKFYASQRLQLTNSKRISKVIDKQTRTIGLNVIAECTKSRFGAPFRQAHFPVIFGYGIDDIGASTEFLLGLKSGDDMINVLNEMLGTDYKASTFTTSIAKKLEKLSDEELMRFKSDLDKLVKEEWDRVETTFARSKKKYY